MAAKASFFKRILPKSLVSFTSYQGRKMFKEALEQGNMESYFELAEQYVTQSRPEDCARSSLVMVLNALSLDPGKVWMGAWRWHSEMGLRCLGEKSGMSLNEFCRTALCNGTWLQAYHPLQQKSIGKDPKLAECETHKHDFDIKYASLETFRTAIKASVRRTGMFLVVNHSRKALEQTGDGHYSPLAGFHEQEDHVLVMDVARFKYPAFWCPVQKLYESLTWIDSETQRMRGFVLLSRPKEFASACRVSIDSTSLKRVGSLQGKPEIVLGKPKPDLLPLVYYCYYLASEEMQHGGSLIREVERLQEFQIAKGLDLNPELSQLILEIADTEFPHFLTLIYLALGKSTNPSHSPELTSLLAKIKAELGIMQ